MKITQLKPNTANPRTIKDEKFRKLVASIQDFPKMMALRPIVIDNDGTILGGNMRYRALVELGYTEIPDNWVKRASDLTDEEKRRFIIEDNVPFGQWDWDALGNDWDEAELEDWGLDVWQPMDEQMNLSTEGREGNEEYDAFKEKFEAKLTTDDCYTPPKIYEVVKKWVDENITPLKGRKIIRPFYPGGDYENEDYPEGCIVLDNPPFSISAKILDFYLEHKIPFFLFGNGLTLLSVKREGVTYILTGEGIVFENGAVVNIGYYTNLCPKVRIWLASDLAEGLRQVQEATADLPKNKWDIHIQSAALLSKIAKRVTLKIMADECEFISTLSDGSAIYGGGVILNDLAAKRTDEERRRADEERSVSKNLGAKERQIVERLNRKAAEI